MLTRLAVGFGIKEYPYLYKKGFTPIKKWFPRSF
jgi:hypothetical protein